ncbi:MAG: TIGR03809 family protein [Bradyrhizobium sp.]
MTDRTDVARGRDLVARWCALAERRLEYLTELFETGRWRRYHGERAILENIREAKATVEIWRDLQTREASLDNSAVDFSWLGRARPTLPRADYLQDRASRLQSQPPAKPGLHVVAGDAGAAKVAADEMPAAPDLPAVPVAQPAAALTLDLDVMQRRYPLLRNVL